MADYHGNYRAIDEHVLCSEFMLAAMFERAQRMKLYAESIAPVGDERGGHYADSFEAEAYIYTSKEGKRRASGVLRNTHADAIAVEYGTGDRPQGGSSPEHATLRKALDAAG